jgi:hypothetical protein
MSCAPSSDVQRSHQYGESPGLRRANDLPDFLGGGLGGGVTMNTSRLSSQCSSRSRPSFKSARMSVFTGTFDAGDRASATSRWWAATRAKWCSTSSLPHERAVCVTSRKLVAQERGHQWLPSLQLAARGERPKQPLPVEHVGVEVLSRHSAQSADESGRAGVGLTISSPERRQKPRLGGLGARRAPSRDHGANGLVKPLLALRRPRSPARQTRFTRGRSLVRSQSRPLSRRSSQSPGSRRPAACRRLRNVDDSYPDCRRPW